MTARRPLPPRLRARAFSVSEGQRHGLTRRRMQGADLARPFHGVRATSPPAALIDRCRAFLVRMPEAGVFSSITAAMILGVPLPIEFERATSVHVAVPTPHRAPRGAGVTGHKLGLGTEDTFVIAGLPVTRPERTWLDLAKELELDDLVAAGDYLIHHRGPFTSAVRLAAYAERHPGDRGIRSARIALPLLDERAESRQESLLRLVLVRGGLEGFLSNYVISLPGTTRTYRADFAHPDKKVILEYQSDYHRDPEQWRADMTRISRLEAHGWVVIQINANDLRHPHELVTRIALVLAAR